MPNTQCPPFSGRYQSTKPENLVPSWLTIALAPPPTSTFAHADTEKLASVRSVFGAVTCAWLVASSRIPEPTAPGA